MIRKFAVVLIIAVAALGVTGVASAQDSDGAAAAGQNNVQNLVQQLRQKAQKLQQIHSEALENDSDLQDQQDQFTELLRQSIKDQGYDIDAGRDHVQDLAKKLKSGDLSDDERQSVMEKITSERQSLIKARDAALKQPKVQKASEQLREATLTAMNKQDPNVDSMIEDMKNIRGQLQNATQQQQQPQQ